MIDIYLPESSLDQIHPQYLIGMIQALLWNRFHMESFVRTWKPAHQTIKIPDTVTTCDRKDVEQVINDAFDMCCRESDIPAWLQHR